MISENLLPSPARYTVRSQLMIVTALSNDKSQKAVTKISLSQRKVHYFYVRSRIEIVS